MYQDRHFINNLWRWKCGLPEIPPEGKLPSIHQLKETQWNNTFETLMKNRMVLGTYRYGDFRDSNQLKRDRIKSAIKRLHKYIETGNGEFLVDTANLCLIEFTKPNNKKFHFSPIDDGEHAEEII